MRPARLKFRGMDPWVKPEDDSADKGAMLTTEAVEPSVTGSKKRGSGEPPRASVTGSEIGVDKSRCLDGACGEYGQIDEDSRL